MSYLVLLLAALIVVMLVALLTGPAENMDSRPDLYHDPFGWSTSSVGKLVASPIVSIGGKYGGT